MKSAPSYCSIDRCSCCPKAPVLKQLTPKNPQPNQHLSQCKIQQMNVSLNFCVSSVAQFSAPTYFQDRAISTHAVVVYPHAYNHDEATRHDGSNPPSLDTSCCISDSARRLASHSATQHEYAPSYCPQLQMSLASMPLDLVTWLSATHKPHPRRRPRPSPRITVRCLSCLKS